MPLHLASYNDKQLALGETAFSKTFLRWTGPLLWMGMLINVMFLATMVSGDNGVEKPATALQTYQGQVVRLGEILKEDGVSLDPDASPFSLALRTPDGKLLPILKTLGSRALFQDARLLHKPVQVQARPVPGSSILIVYRFYTLKNGKPHEVYYWCETCAIRRDYPEKGVCECCGAPMELREVPLPQ